MKEDGPLEKIYIKSLQFKKKADKVVFKLSNKEEWRVSIIGIENVGRYNCWVLNKHI